MRPIGQGIGQQQRLLMFPQRSLLRILRRVIMQIIRPKPTPLFQAWI